MEKNKTFDPELVRLFKIFGIASLVWVFGLSFFNEKSKVVEEGTPQTSITAASRLYFMNVRQAFYDRENRLDAKMNIFRLKKREKDGEGPVLNLSIIINRIKDDAYIFIEPSVINDNQEFVIKFHLENGDNGEITFSGGDRYDHYRFVEKVYPLLLQDARFKIKMADEWMPLLEEKGERDAFRITSFDYFRLIEREEMNP